jgi:hypothetical protein
MLNVICKYQKQLRDLRCNYLYAEFVASISYSHQGTPTNVTHIFRSLELSSSCQQRTFEVGEWPVMWLFRAAGSKGRQKECFAYKDNDFQHSAFFDD